MGMGIINFKKRQRKRTFQGLVMIYLSPKTKQKMGKDFLMREEVGEHILSRGNDIQFIYLVMNSVHIHRASAMCSTRHWALRI